MYHESNDCTNDLKGLEPNMSTECVNRSMCNKKQHMGRKGGVVSTRSSAPAQHCIHARERGSAPSPAQHCTHTCGGSWGGAGGGDGKHTRSSAPAQHRIHARERGSAPAQAHPALHPRMRNMRNTKHTRSRIERTPTKALGYQYIIYIYIYAIQPATSSKGC